MMLLEATGLCKEYQLAQRHVVAVDHVDFALNKGELVSIIGRSGSGKSTLINMLAGLLTPTAGNVCFEGQDYTSFTDHELCHLRNEKIGYIPQGMCLLSHFNVLDNVRLPFFLGERSGTSIEHAQTLLRQVGLEGYGEQYPHQLSGGQMRRVAIARALMNTPALIIADEPTSNLDVETAQEITGLLKQLCEQGAAVLVVSHEQDTLKFSDHIYQMNAGRLDKLANH